MLLDTFLLFQVSFQRFLRYCVIKETLMLAGSEDPELRI